MEHRMLTRADQARTRQRLMVASLLIKLAEVLAPRRMEWWVGTPVAQWLRRLAQRITQ
jgi:hypothetical protein